MKDIVEETAKASLVPESLAAINAIAAVSASIGAGLVIESGGDRTTPANLFVIGIAQSGSGKGVAFKRIFQSFRDEEAEHAKLMIEEELPALRAELQIVEVSIKQSVASIKKETDEDCREQSTRDIVDLEKEKSRLQRELAKPLGYSVADVTCEKLAVALSSQPGEALASLSPEARGVIDVLSGRYAKGESSDEAIYLSAYSREQVRVDRIGRESTILNSPTLTVLWLIQPDAAFRFCNNSAMFDSGMLPRFILINTKATLEDEAEIPYEMDASMIACWDRLIKQLLSDVRAKGDNPEVVRSAPEAATIIREFSNEVKRTARPNMINEDIASFVARWGENTWRLALVLHTVEHGAKAIEHLLSQETANKAVELMRWFIDQQLELLRELRKSKGRPLARDSKLLDIVRDAGGEKSIRDLTKDNGFDKKEVLGIIAKHPEEISFETRQTGGRPSDVVVLSS